MTDYFSHPRKRLRPSHSIPTPPTSQPHQIPDRYALHNGFDTPSLIASSTDDNDSLQHSLGDGRRWRGSQQASSYYDDQVATPLSGPLARERNGVARVQPAATWTGLAFGLVGKVFTFGSSVIRGFYAGGGKGYELHLSPQPDGMWSLVQDRCSTPLPGSYDDFLGDFEQDNISPLPPSQQARPALANKRRQTDRDAWVLIGTPDLEVASPGSPKRKVARPAVQSPTTRPSLASRAPSRRSLAPLPVSRRQSGNIPTNLASASGSPAEHRDGRASFAPVRSSNSRPSSAAGHTRGGSLSNHVFITPEAEKLVKRRAKEDRKADVVMSDMSRRLQEMIRQGQEALGTRVEVEGDGMGMEVEEERFWHDER